MTRIEPGRFTRAAIHSEGGEVEIRLSDAGNWQLAIRAGADREWKLACSGDLRGGASLAAPSEDRDPPIRLGALTLDRSARSVKVGGNDVALTAREYGLLAMLASQPNKLFTREELMRSIWGCEALRTTRTLDSHASRLRNKLRRAGAEGFVINFRAVGYRLWEGAELQAAQRRPAA